MPRPGHRLRRIALGALLAGATAAAAPAAAAACTDEVAFDPTVPTLTRSSASRSARGRPATPGRRQTADLLAYFAAVQQWSQSSSRVRIVAKELGTSGLGKPLRYFWFFVAVTREHRQPRRGPQRRRVLGGRPQPDGLRGDRPRRGRAARPSAG